MKLTPADYLVDEDAPHAQNRLGKPIEAAEQQSRQFSRTWDQVATAEPYAEIPLSGRVIHVNMATSPGALFVFHVDQVGRPIFLSRGYTKTTRHPFRRLYVQRPTSPIVVPADAARLLVVDVAENPEDIRPGADDPYQNAGLGATNPTTAQKTATAATTTAFAADPLVSRVRLQNLDPAESILYSFSTPVTAANSGLLQAGDVREFPSNANLYVLRAGAANVVYAVEIFK